MLHSVRAPVAVAQPPQLPASLSLLMEPAVPKEGLLAQDRHLETVALSTDGVAALRGTVVQVARVDPVRATRGSEVPS